MYSKRKLLLFEDMQIIGLLCGLWLGWVWIPGSFWGVGRCLIRWGRVMHICFSKLTIIGSDNGLSPGRHQAIIWTNAGIWSIGPLGTNSSEILIETDKFSFRKMDLKLSSAKWWPSCLGLNVLTKSRWNKQGKCNFKSIFLKENLCMLFKCHKVLFDHPYICH